MVETSTNKVKTEYEKLMDMKDLTDAQDKSIGCILGAFIGDSLGAYLEFSTGYKLDAKVN